MAVPIAASRPRERSLLRSVVAEDVTFATGEAIPVLVDGAGLEREILGLASVGERRDGVMKEANPWNSQPGRGSPRKLENDDRPKVSTSDWFSPAVTV